MRETPTVNTILTHHREGELELYREAVRLRDENATLRAENARMQITAKELRQGLKNKRREIRVIKKTAKSDNDALTSIMRDYKSENATLREELARYQQAGCHVEPSTHCSGCAQVRALESANDNLRAIVNERNEQLARYQQAGAHFETLPDFSRYQPIETPPARWQNTPDGKPLYCKPIDAECTSFRCADCEQAAEARKIWGKIFPDNCPYAQWGWYPPSSHGYYCLHDEDISSAPHCAFETCPLLREEATK